MEMIDYLRMQRFKDQKVGMEEYPNDEIIKAKTPWAAEEICKNATKNRATTIVSKCVELKNVICNIWDYEFIVMTYNLIFRLSLTYL